MKTRKTKNILDSVRSEKRAVQTRLSQWNSCSHLHGGSELRSVELGGALHQTQHQSLQRARERPLQGGGQILGAEKQEDGFYCSGICSSISD